MARSFSTLGVEKSFDTAFDIGDFDGEGITFDTTFEIIFL